MRLHSITFNNFRRFAGEWSLIIDDPIVALVGPNEAGKTSVLRALQKCAARLPFAAQDVTRGVDVADIKSPLVRMKFLLEEDDIKAIASIPHADTPKWIILNGGVDKKSINFSPMPGRDMMYLKRVADLIDSTLTTGQVDAAGHQIPVLDSDPISKALRQVQKALPSFADFRAKVVPAAKLGSIGTALQYLGVVVHGDPEAFAGESSESGEKGVSPGALRNMPRIDRKRYSLPEMERLGNELVALRASLGNQAPAFEIANALMARLPQVVYFTEEDRDLPGVFDLTSDEPIPRGLVNLMRLARLDGEALRRAVHEDDHLQLVEITEQANLTLKEAFRSWRQESIWPILHVSNGSLRILVRAANTNSYTNLGDRSDGLRQFIALLACIHAARYLEKEERDVVVLIDEAENHLHYDAQADLVEVFTRQQSVKQIIYSTHSAGCLPEDLGTGVRVIRPIPGTPNSAVQNWFWSDGAGFTPLLLSMGASSLAFASVRRVVLTEGPTEMLLLPSLLRQANAVQSLGYQVAPGLSEVSPRLTADLDLEAARSCFVVDGDAGGNALRQKLIDAGISETRVLFLGGKGSEVNLESLVDEATYRRCVNTLLDGGKSTQMPDDFTLDPSDRYAAVREWCTKKGISVPSKRLVAQCLARESREENIVASEHMGTLQDLHSSVSSILDRM
jgi:predicted ATP-dependent endonuclease of OLD family